MSRLPIGSGSPTGALVARTLPLGRIPDLASIGGRPGGVLWTRQRAGLAGVGVALRIELPTGLDGGDVAGVVEVLGSIPTEDHVGLAGCGPVALGALAFERAAPASLVVPRWIVGRADDRAWLTTVAPASGPGAPSTATPAGIHETVAALEAGGPAGEPPDRFDLVPAMAHAGWRQLVEGAVAAIRGGELAKVVLARRVDILANRDFVVPDVLDRLLALYPACMIFHVGGFVGASPELLVERDGTTVRSLPLAGTVARSGDHEADERLVAGLVDSAKERGEHRLVIDELAGALGPLCDRLEVPDRPEILALRNVSHLATPLVGHLRPSPLPSVLELVARVHPTPAVAGTPTLAALDHLRRAEGFDRGPYAGPVGWMDHRGDGAWAVGIRSARLRGPSASIYAGVGVVADSDPAAELAETQLKLQALLAALVRP
ncbi:MAG: isochorismate synthase [Acidimicrobiales bacterium]